MNESIKTVFTRIISFFTAAALLIGNVMLFYYPHYQENKAEYEISVPAGEDTLRVMSCNVRCINPLDMGKKTWFYRADLVIKNIVNNRRSQNGSMPISPTACRSMTRSSPTAIRPSIPRAARYFIIRSSILS